MAGAVVLAVLVVAAWFPASALYTQHEQLASSSSQLARLRAQDRALHQEQARLGSSSEVARIARQQYQLVDPGQQAYEVLPPSSAAAGSSYGGDPGLQGPVAPSGASELPPGSVRPSPTSSGISTDRHSATASSAKGLTHGAGAGGANGVDGSSDGIVGRIVQTLEFWR
jgi:cell division protein FtsL